MNKSNSKFDMENKMDNNQESVVENKNKKTWIIGGIALVLVITAAAFVGGRMFGQQANRAAATPSRAMC